ncbi:hypothetical protein J0656_11910 [Muricauda ruestringensis]|uniref:SMODS-associated and fused to various effectors domain-containing protein n=1 Tax=Flagellimonas aurea TaxID=2915619 RepID=A0ABS3G5L8_9FLAO|nr:hypothetical protein [Allomuricauda aurea]MBO0354721.1 hypothetical protein [Allomuricauda aurea]
MISLSGKVNVLICSSSFERRCFAVVDQINTAKFDELLVFRVADLNHRIIINSELFGSKLSVNTSSYVNVNINDITSSFFEIRASLKRIFSGPKSVVTVDITTFTHEGLLIVFRLIKDFKRDIDQVFFIYNGASAYSCKEEDEEEKWLTKGVRESRNIIGYPGDSDISKVNHLVILFGFETDRTRRLIHEMDYEYISFAYGSKKESVTNAHQKINEERHEKLMNQYPDKVMGDFEISLTNPIVARDQILGYISRFSDHRIVIAPMNNKISTLGAGLVAIENKKVQLQYLQPNLYNFDGYSEAGDDFYVWELN